MCSTFVLYSAIYVSVLLVGYVVLKLVFKMQQADLSAALLKKKNGIHALSAPQLPQSHFACGWTNQVHNYSANQSGAQLWLWGS